MTKKVTYCDKHVSSRKYFFCSVLTLHQRGNGVDVEALRDRFPLRQIAGKGPKMGSHRYRRLEEIENNARTFMSLQLENNNLFINELKEQKGSRVHE